MAKTQLGLLKGTLDMLVLHILQDGNQHGFAIARRLESLTDDALRVEEGSLYPALYRMEKRRWIASDWGTTENNRRARYYRITAGGRAHLAAQASQWDQFVLAVGKVMDSGDRP